MFRIIPMSDEKEIETIKKDSRYEKIEVKVQLSISEYRAMMKISEQEQRNPYEILYFVFLTEAKRRGLLPEGWPVKNY